MIHRFVRHGAVCCALGVVSAAPGAVSAQSMGSEAETVLRQMSVHVAGLRQVRIEAEILFDRVEASGEKIELSNRTRVDVLKPDRLYVQTSGDAVNRRLWYDAKEFCLLRTKEKLYSKLPMTGSVDSVLGVLSEKYGVTVPVFTELLAPSPYSALTQEVLTGRKVGVHRVRGRECHHLALTQKDIDWQIWIETGNNPVPRKIVITYKNRPGQPQYSVVFIRWDTKVDFDDAHFTLVASGGWGRIQLAPVGAASETRPTKP